MAKNSDASMTAFPIDFMSKCNSMTFETFQTASGETTKFITKRLQEDLAVARNLMSCKHPTDVMEVWSNFYTTALKDYAEQTGKVFIMLEKAAEETKDTAKEVVEVSEAVLETFENKAA